MVIVQHMPKGFTTSMANRLDGLGPVNVREAEDGAELRAGEALVCAGDRHMTLTRTHVVYNDDAPVVGLRPRADITLTSAASVFGRGVLGIVFTGMGRDGLAGGAAIVEAGGRMWAQDAESSLVDGMPRAVRSANLTEFAGTPADLADQIEAVFMPAPTARRS
jgi:two-component system chemotaxis response regulator CheB